MWRMYSTCTYGARLVCVCVSAGRGRGNEVTYTNCCSCLIFHAARSPDSIRVDGWLDFGRTRCTHGTAQHYSALNLSLIHFIHSFIEGGISLNCKRLKESRGISEVPSF